MLTRQWKKSQQYVLLVAGTGFALVAAHYVMVHDARAQVMESSSYKIEFDSINTAGNRSVSGSYIIEDTTGEVGTGPSDSASYQLRAGYQQMNETFISISAAADVTLLPSLGGITGGTSTGETEVTVITDNLAGYQMTIQASSSPALRHTTENEQIDDYTPVGGDPDYVFAVALGGAEFGFTPEGVDVAQRYLDDGAGTCNTDSNETTDACWDALSTSERTIATRGSSNHPDGSTTTVKFQAVITPNAGVVAGTYVATTTITAVTL